MPIRCAADRIRSASGPTSRQGLVDGPVPELPILITGGADDPVGGERGMHKLSEHYAVTGHRHLAAKIYPGGRHEMLNETNREEFTTDVLRWIDSALGGHHV